MRSRATPARPPGRRSLTPLGLLLVRQRLPAAATRFDSSRLDSPRHPLQHRVVPRCSGRASQTDQPAPTHQDHDPCRRRRRRGHRSRCRLVESSRIELQFSFIITIVAFIRHFKSRRRRACVRHDLMTMIVLSFHDDHAAATRPTRARALSAS